MRGDLFDVLQSLVDDPGDKDRLGEVAQELLRLGAVHATDEFILVGVDPSGRNRVVFFRNRSPSQFGGMGSPHPCPFQGRFSGPASKATFCNSEKCDEDGVCRMTGDRLDISLHK